MSLAKKYFSQYVVKLFYPQFNLQKIKQECVSASLLLHDQHISAFGVINKKPHECWKSLGNFNQYVFPLSYTF